MHNNGSQNIRLGGTFYEIPKDKRIACVKDYRVTGIGSVLRFNCCLQPRSPGSLLCQAFGQVNLLQLAEPRSTELLQGSTLNCYNFCHPPS